MSRCWLLACASAVLTAQDVAGDAAIPIADTGLHCKLPAGYRTVASSAGALFLAQGPAVDGARAMVAVSAGPMVFPRGTNAELRDGFVATLGGALPGFQVLADGRRPLLSRQTWWLLAGFRRGDDDLRQLVILLPGWPCYWCTFTVLAKAYDAALPAFEQWLQSLERRGPSPAAALLDCEPVFAAGRVTVAALGLELAPPPGWRPVAAVLTKGALFACAGSASDGIAPNVSVQLRPPGDPVDVAAVRAELRLAERSGLCVLECLAVELAGRRVVRSLVELGPPGRRLIALQYLVPGAPQGLLLTYTVPAGDAERLLPLLEQSAASLVFGREPSLR